MEATIFIIIIVLYVGHKIYQAGSEGIAQAKVQKELDQILEDNIKTTMEHIYRK